MAATARDAEHRRRLRGAQDAARGGERGAGRRPRPRGPACPRPRTALELWTRAKTAAGTAERVPTGCAALDAALGGGLLPTGITEVCGEAGCGKTQLVLRLLASALLKREGQLAGRSVYICTEGRAPTARLRGILASYRTPGASCAASWGGQGQMVREEHVFDRVLVKEIHDQERLSQTLEEGLPQLLAKASLAEDKRGRGPVRLVVVDSLAAVLRLGGDTIARGGSSRESLLQRSQWFLRIARRLKELSDIYSCCIVVVNQVSAGSRDLHAALGLTWSNCVNTRIMLSRPSPSRRTLSVLFSPAIPDMCISYCVTHHGLCACEPASSTPASFVSSTSSLSASTSALAASPPVTPLVAQSRAKQIATSSRSAQHCE